MSPQRSWRPAARRGAPLRLAAASLVAVAGCGALTTTPPAPTAADFPGIAGLLLRNGLTVDAIVSGDAGCDDRELARTAIAFDAAGLDQPTSTRVHIYIFRNEPALERLRSRVEACVRSYANDPESFGFVEEAPFIAAGAGPWAPDFRAAIEAALREGAGG